MSGRPVVPVAVRRRIRAASRETARAHGAARLTTLVERLAGIFSASSALLYELPNHRATARLLASAGLTADRAAELHQVPVAGRGDDARPVLPESACLGRGVVEGSFRAIAGGVWIGVYRTEEPFEPYHPLALHLFAREVLPTLESWRFELLNELSPRQIEVLALAVQGGRPREVAAHLGLSVYTVRAHLRAIYRRLSVHSCAELIQTRAVREVFERPVTPEGVARAQRLPPRLRQVLALLLGGLSEKEVATRLALSAHTVHDHTRAIYQRLGVHSRAELIARYGGVPDLLRWDPP